MSDGMTYNVHSMPVESLHVEGMTREEIANLPPGAALVMHPDGRVEILENGEALAALQREGAETYKPVHPRAVSLESCVGDGQADTIAFYVRLQFSLDFEKLKAQGHWKNPDWLVPLYHGHRSLWYSLVVSQEDQGDRYSFTVVSARRLPQQGAKEEEQSSLPPFLMAELILTHVDNVGTTKLETEGRTPDGHIYFRDRFSEEQLRDLSEDGELTVSLFFVLPRSYFSLAAVIDLNAKHTVPAGARAVVETILRGEKPDGSDWEITGTHFAGDEDVYSVHKANFANLSSKMKTAPGAAEVGLLSGLNDAGVRMAIRIAYGVEAPLPERGEDVKPLVDSLHDLFGDRFAAVVLPQWEREICKKALALDTREPTPSSMIQLLHLLNVVRSAPDNLCPVAYRVVMGVLADMAHFNAHSSLEQWVHEEVMPYIAESGIDFRHINSLLDSFYKLMNIVPRVEKWALAAAGGLVDRSLIQDMDQMNLDEAGDETGEEEDGEEEEEEGDEATSGEGQQKCYLS